MHSAPKQAKSPSVLVVTNMYPSPADPAKGTFVRNAVKQLTDRGWDVRVNALQGTRSRLQRVMAYLKFYAGGLRAQFFPGSDLTYVHYTSHSSPAVLLGRLLGARARVVAHVHGSDVIPERGTAPIVARVKCAFSRALLRASALVVVPSAYFKQVLVNQYEVAERDIFVSPSGGIDTQVFAPNEHRRSDDSLRVLFVGRLIEEKGPLDFLQLLDEARARGLQVEATLVGDGPLASRVDAESRRLQLRRVVRMPQTELAALVSEHDLFIFPSTREAESLGLVGLEAMSCGLPVLAYQSGGATTYVEHGINGYLVPKSDVAAMVQCVTEFAAKPESERRRMREAARERACAYDSHTVAAELDAALRALL